jgi:hypothetical protein
LKVKRLKESGALMKKESKTILNDGTDDNFMTLEHLMHANLNEVIEPVLADYYFAHVDDMRAFFLNMELCGCKEEDITVDASIGDFENDGEYFIVEIKAKREALYDKNSIVKKMDLPLFKREYVMTLFFRKMKHDDKVHVNKNYRNGILNFKILFSNHLKRSYSQTSEA